MNNLEDLGSAIQRLNEGEQIAEVEPSLIEQMWKALSRTRSEWQPTGAGAVAARLDPDLAPPTPELKLAMMVRYALLDALIERGILDEYLKEETLRKKVFAAAARVPCDQSDLHEVLAERVLRQSPPEIAQKIREDLVQRGYAPDHLKVAGKFIAWIHDNC